MTRPRCIEKALSLVILAHFLVIVSAQSSFATVISDVSVASTATSPSSTPSRTPQVYLVKVGAGGFNYDPANLTAEVGDIVTFEFYPPDHSVARADFGSPCIPYENSGPNRVGFWSGTQTVGDVNHLTHWNLTINDTAPVFYYCGAPNSCIGQQMVGVINPNASQTLEQQVTYAKNAKVMYTPGGTPPPEASSLLSATATSAPTSSPSSSGVTNGDGHHGLATGAIVGIAVGGVVVLAICGALFFFVGRTKSYKEVLRNRDAAAAAAAATKETPSTPGAGTDFGSPQAPPPGSPGYASPFSPTPQQQAEMGNPPVYGQHYATEAHPQPGGWMSPTNQPPVWAGAPQPPHIVEAKTAEQQLAEMPSPDAAQQSFSAVELEASLKTPRG